MREQDKTAKNDYQRIRIQVIDFSVTDVIRASLGGGEIDGFKSDQEWKTNWGNQE